MSHRNRTLQFLTYPVNLSFPLGSLFTQSIAVQPPSIAITTVSLPYCKIHKELNQ